MGDSRSAGGADICGSSAGWFGDNPGPLELLTPSPLLRHGRGWVAVESLSVCELTSRCLLC